MPSHSSSSRSTSSRSTTSRSTTSSSSSSSSSPPKREHRCKVCDRVFSRSDNLRTHQRLHSGEKPFDCKYCGQPFRWVGALRTHEAKHVRDGHVVGRKQKIERKQEKKNRRKPSQGKSKDDGRFHDMQRVIVSEEDLTVDVLMDQPWHDVLGDSMY